MMTTECDVTERAALDEITRLLIQRSTASGGGAVVVGLAAGEPANAAFIPAGAASIIGRLEERAQHVCDRRGAGKVQGAASAALRRLAARARRAR